MKKMPKNAAKKALVIYIDPKTRRDIEQMAHIFGVSLTVLGEALVKGAVNQLLSMPKEPAAEIPETAVEVVKEVELVLKSA